MPYNPLRGGHAPGHLREAFCDWVDAYTEEDVAYIDDEPKPLRWLIGQLWNCDDTLPRSTYDALDLNGTQTYAVAVRTISQRMAIEEEARKLGVRPFFA